MKSSEFLVEAAQAIDSGFSMAAVPCNHSRWFGPLTLTLPECACYDHHAEDIVQTRVLRLCLASAIAESEGD